jgi:hypothetical protein
MARAVAIQWLENETGEEIDYVPEAPGQDRQLSVRLTGVASSALLVARDAARLTGRL